MGGGGGGGWSFPRNVIRPVASGNAGDAFLREVAPQCELGHPLTYRKLGRN